MRKSKIITAILMASLLFALSGVVALAKPATVAPRYTRGDVTYTLAPGQSKTTYKYAVPSSASRALTSCLISTPGGTVHAVFYGAYSTSAANHEISSGDGEYGVFVDETNLSLESSNDYPMYCAKVTNTSSVTIQVTVSIYDDLY